MKETPASDLERRKKVRLRVRPDLGVTPQKYEGRTYYFCSQECKEEFEKNPQRFAGQTIR